jgi:glycosyltransferase involved in cell wall biosynthesis
MKIVYVYPHFRNYGGTERVLIDKMNYFASQEGYEVFSVTHEQGNYPMAYKMSSLVKHIDLGLRYGPLFKYNSLIRLYKGVQFDRLLKSRYDELMQSLRPDIVIATTYYNNSISIVGSCPVSYVRILESHIDKRYILNNDPLNRKSFLRWLHTSFLMKSITCSARLFDLLVTLNEEDTKDWSEYVKTTVISNVVHLNPTKKISDSKSKRVIFVGRYTEQKGIDDLFRVWQLVHHKYPDWHVDLYGEGHLMGKLLYEAKRLNIGIEVHKPDKDIFSRYLESSIFVLTSIFEPFGLVMSEAMSCGLPVVAFDCPYGPKEIIEDGKTGFLIPNRDITYYAEKVCDLIKSHELRKKMGEAAVVSSQRFSFDKIMPLWKDLFEKLTKSSVS